MSGSRWVITPSWLSGSWRSFLYSSVYSCHLFGPRRSTPAATDYAEVWWIGATPCPRSGAATENARLQWRRRGRDELPQAQGQGQRPRGATPHPRCSGCMGAGGLRGATPRSRSGGAALRRYPSPKVSSSGSALLEQLWRDTPRPR